MRVGVISDTHGVVHPGVFEIFAEVDCILHAGDIGGEGVLKQLARLAPLYAISGNADAEPLASELPGKRVVVLDKVKILLTHRVLKGTQILPEVSVELERESPRAVVFGHSHIPFSQNIDRVYFFNPGGGGRKRFALPRAVGILTLKDGEIMGQHCYLDR